jgi:hypothetical protein
MDRVSVTVCIRPPEVAVIVTVEVVVSLPPLGADLPPHPLSKLNVRAQAKIKGSFRKNYVCAAARPGTKPLRPAIPATEAFSLEQDVLMLLPGLW